MEPKISIIVPVYKVEPYIHKCVDSILNQTFKDFELILVDDGSPDNCGKICDEYAQKDNRVKVIHKENGGQATARNAALDIARGEYIGFVDSDDYIEKDMYEKLYRCSNSNNADISIIGVKEVSELGNILYEYIPKSINLSEILKRAHAWNKLFKKKLFFENNLFFIENKYYEDLELIPKLFIKANKVCSINDIAYIYLQREGSTTRKRDEKILDMLWAYKEIKKFLLYEGIFENYENEFMISISYFKIFFINILRESPTRFILKNYIYIVNSFNELDDLNKFDIVIFFIKHIKTRFLLKYNY